MKVLILGAKGNLGQAFVDLYADEEVFAWDREKVDIGNEEEVSGLIVNLAPDLIINCAAYNAVDKAEDERELAMNINGYAVGYIAKAANKAGATLVHFSTNYVFAGDKITGYNENDLPKPQSVYAESKLLGETELQKHSRNFYLIRTSWLYGGKSATGKLSFVELMLKLASDGKKIGGIKDEFASPTYVVDLAQAGRVLVEEKKPFGIYHLVNAGSVSWYDWAKEIFAIKKVNAKLAAISRDDYPRRAARPQYGTLNNAKFMELRPWTEALEEYLSSKT